MLLSTIVTFSVILASASADVTCDDCRGFGDALQGYLMSEASVTEQTELLASIGCPSVEDPDRCEELVRAYWKDLASAIYPEFLKPTEVCTKIGLCTRKSFLNTPNCEECKDTLTKVSAVIADFEQIQEIVEFLKTQFCPSSVDSTECETSVELLIPAAMPILSALLTDRSAELCCKLSSTGLCC